MPQVEWTSYLRGADAKAKLRQHKPQMAKLNHTLGSGGTLQQHHQSARTLQQHPAAPCMLTQGCAAGMRQDSPTLRCACELLRICLVHASTGFTISIGIGDATG